MAQLDVLITISESTPRQYVNHCRRTVREAVDRASYPINVIEVPGVPGHIGRAMLNGLNKSTAPYVAWVDDDDFVLPNAFTCLTSHFAGGPTAICAREISLLANGRIVTRDVRHALTAWRRDIPEKAGLDDNPGYPLVPMLDAVKDTAVDEFSWVYVYRIRRSGGMQLRKQHGSIRR